MSKAADVLNRLSGSVGAGSPTQTASLPNVPNTTDSGLTAFLSALKENVETWRGDRGAALDSAVTWRQLIDKQLATIDLTQAPARPGDVPNLKPGSGKDYAIPPAPTNVSVAGAIANTIITWNDPVYPNHAYAEIWRASTDNLADAVKVGIAPGAVYADSIGSDQTYFYWVRFVSTSDMYGPFNSYAGSVGRTGQDPEYLMQLLSGAIGGVPFYTLESPTTVDGIVIPPGTYIKNAYIVDGSITRAKIADAAIDNAKIANLDAAKITSGYIDAARINANSITADKIDSRGLAIRDAQGNVLFGAGTLLAPSYIDNLAGAITDAATPAMSLSPPAVVLPSNAIGAVDFNAIPTPLITVKLKRGVADETALWTITADSTNVTATVNQVGKTVTITAIADDSGHIDITATRSGYTDISQRIYVIKAKQGAQGLDYRIVIESTNGNIFKPGQPTSTILKAHVFLNDQELTNVMDASNFKWRRVSYYPQESPYDDATWNALYAAGYKQIEVTSDNVLDRATFHCDVSIPTN